MESVLRRVATAEEERHDESGADGADGFDEAAEGVAAEGDLFGERCDGQRLARLMRSSQKARGAVQRVDVQRAGERHGKDGEDGHSPADGGADGPLGSRRWGAGAVRGRRGESVSAGDGVEQREADSEQEEQEEG